MGPTKHELEAGLLQAFAQGDHRRCTTLAVRGWGPEIFTYLRSLFGTRAPEAYAQWEDDMASQWPHFRPELGVSRGFTS